MNEEQTPELNNPTSGLNPKQERFCLEYLKDFNATAAAKRAGYAAGSAHVTGSRLLDLPEVQQFLRTELDHINTQMRIASEAVNRELLDITYLQRGDFLDDAGNLINPKKLPEHLRGAVQIQTKIIQTEDKITTVTTLSLFNKINMMDKISKRQKPGKDGATSESHYNLARLGDGTEVKY